MPGVDAPRFIESKIAQKPVVLFSKSYCPESKKIRCLMQDEYKLDYKQMEVVNIERRQDVNQIEDYFMVMCLSEKRELPQLWVAGQYIGNEFKIMRLHENGELIEILSNAEINTPPVNAYRDSMRTIIPASTPEDGKGEAKDSSEPATNVASCTKTQPQEETCETKGSS